MLDSHASAEMPPANGGNILIVDDTPDNLVFLATLLTDAGYSVRKVISGQMGINAAQAEAPDLVLLDILMPGMSGYEVCQQMKASELTRDVPVIFLSALDEELDKVQAFQIGAVDYITKPFQVVEVLARIETHLKIGRLQAQLQQQNARLQQEINSRTAAESAVQILNQGLEARIQERITLLKADHTELMQQKTALETALSQERQQNARKTQQQNAAVAALQTAIARIQPALKQIRQTASTQQTAPLHQIESATQRLIELLQELL